MKRHTYLIPRKRCRIKITGKEKSKVPKTKQKRPFHQKEEKISTLLQAIYSLDDNLRNNKKYHRAIKVMRRNRPSFVASK